MEAKKTEARTDLILGIILLLGSIFIFAISLRIPSSPYEPLGAAFLPKTLSGFIGLLSVILIVSSLYQGNKVDRKSEKVLSEQTTKDSCQRRPLLAWAVVISIFLYIFLMPFIGFRLATFIFMISLGTVIYRREKSSKPLTHYLTLLMIALTLSFGLHYLFTSVMFVNLP